MDCWAEEYLMFKATNVENHFRVGNFVSRYRWGVRLVVSRRVFLSKHPALKYQL